MSAGERRDKSLRLTLFFLGDVLVHDALWHLDNGCCCCCCWGLPGGVASHTKLCHLKENGSAANGLVRGGLLLLLQKKMSFLNPGTFPNLSSLLETDHLFLIIDKMHVTPFPSWKLSIVFLTRVNSLLTAGIEIVASVS